MDEIPHIGKDREPAGRLDVLALMAVLFSVFLVHSQVLGFGFAYDDGWTILDNSYLHESYALVGLLDGTAAGLHAPDAGRPVLVAMHWFEWRLFGGRASGYHLVSLILHLWVTLLVILLLARLTRRPRVGLLGGLLFGLHPMAAEAVAVISFREDLLAAGFLFSWWLVLLRQPFARGSLARAFGVASGLLYGLAVASKESAALGLLLVPVATALAEGRPLRDELRIRGAGYASAAVVLASLLVLRLALFGQLNPYAGPYYPHPGDLWHASFAIRLQVALQAAFFGWQRLWAPVGLAPEYCRLGPASWSVLLVAGGVVACWGAVALWAARIGRREMLVGLLLSLGFFGPTSNLVWMPNTEADRFWYLPAMGWALVAAWLLWEAVRLLRVRGRSALGTGWVLGLLWALVLGLSARRHETLYRDDLTLWAEAARRAPCSARALTGRAETLLRNGEPDEARRVLTSVLQRRDYPPAWYLLGRLSLKQGRLSQARVALQRALWGRYWQPWRIHASLAHVEQGLGRPEEALHQAALAALLAPDEPAARLAAFRTTWSLGRADQAAEHLARALGGRPVFQTTSTHVLLAAREAADLVAVLNDEDEIEELRPVTDFDL